MKKTTPILVTVFFLCTINNVYAYPGKSLLGLCNASFFHESKRIKAINTSTENNAYAMNLLIDNNWYNLDLREGYNKVIPRSEIFKLAQYAFDNKLFVNICTTDSYYITGIEIVAP
ncbi:hypothetical protein [Vibrio pacinii]|uniref:hypothetical protein n=1 Tax=Vibrio pacinii TaxID=170674 RepID=UPI00056F3F67|nr:hypothetical protein [Vibrio pacinii]